MKFLISALAAALISLNCFGMNTDENKHPSIYKDVEMLKKYNSKINAIFNKRPLVFLNDKNLPCKTEDQEKNWQLLQSFNESLKNIQPIDNKIYINLMANELSQLRDENQKLQRNMNAVKDIYQMKENPDNNSAFWQFSWYVKRDENKQMRVRKKVYKYGFFGLLAASAAVGGWFGYQHWNR